MGIKFSIIIPTFNRREMLRSALASARAQAWSNVEIIVVDGGSTDGTVEELESHDDVRILRGPDRGLYDAINKGIEIATGDIIGLLNSDDVYEAGTFAAIADAFIIHPEADSVCGTARLIEDGRIIAEFSDDRDKTMVSARTILIGACIPNARFFRRTAMLDVGPFSLDYKYVADRDWLMRWHQLGMRTVAISWITYCYLHHSESLTFNNDHQSALNIRKELLRLAHYWRTTTSANANVRLVALTLEGRCRAKLALNAARSRKLGDVINYALCEDGRLSSTPPLALIVGGIDRLVTTCFKAIGANNFFQH